MMSGILTAILLVAFLLMIFWAWSAKRTDDFEHLSKLPLDEKPISQSKTKGGDNGPF